MSLFFNSSPFWDLYDSLDSDFFGPLDNTIRVSPRVLTGRQGSRQEGRDQNSNQKSIARQGDKHSDDSQSSNSLFRSVLNDSVFKPNFDVVPPVDLIDKESQYELHVSIPGVPKDQISLDFNNGTKELTISGTIPETKVEESEGASKHYREIRAGSFERKVRFGNKANLDEENIKATYKDGILTVVVPKTAPEKEKANLKRIEISDHNEENSKL